MEIKFSVFSVEAFQFSKFYQNEGKHDKFNFKKGLTVKIEVKNSFNCRKKWLKIWKTYFFIGK